MSLRGLFIFLLLLSTALTFGTYTFLNLTDYSIGKHVFPKLISDSLNKQISEEDIKKMENHIKDKCVNKNSVTLNVTREPLEINCSETEKKDFKIVFSNAVYDNIFYKNYECGFFDCFSEKEKIPALIAKQSHKKHSFYYKILLVIDFILAFLLFFVSGAWSRKASSFGYVFLISSLGVFFLLLSQELLIKAKFFKTIIYVQLLMLIAGIALLVISAVLKRKTDEVEKNAKNNSRD